jgi:hypothetical protein
VVVADFGLQRASAVVSAKKGGTYYVEVATGGSVAQMPAESAEPLLKTLYYAIAEPGA